MNMILNLYYYYIGKLMDWHKGLIKRYFFKWAFKYYTLRVRESLEKVFNNLDLRNAIREFCNFLILVNDINKDEEIINSEYINFEFADKAIQNFNITYHRDLKCSYIRDISIFIETTTVNNEGNELHITMELYDNRLNVIVDNISKKKSIQFMYAGIIDVQYAQIQKNIEAMFKLFMRYQSEKVITTIFNSCFKI